MVLSMRLTSNGREYGGRVRYAAFTPLLLNLPSVINRSFTLLHFNSSQIRKPYPCVSVDFLTYQPIASYSARPEARALLTFAST
jgi:hypothetical protein